MQAVTGLSRNMLECVEQSGQWFGRPAHSWHIIGRRTANFSTAVFNDCGEYFSGPIFPKINTPLELVSTSASDTVLGVGARAVRIVYLDAAGALTSTVYNLNGTTPVPVSDMTYVYWMEVHTAPENATSVGNIVLRTVAGSVAVEQITASTNRSLSGRARVPFGWTGYVLDWDASCINQEFEVRLRATRDTFTKQCTPGVWHFLDIFTLEAGGVAGSDRPYRLPEGCEVKISARPLTTSGTPKVEGGFTFVLVSNT